MTSLERKLKAENKKLIAQVTELEEALLKSEEILDIVAEGVKDVRENYVDPETGKFKPIKWYEFKKWVEVASFAIAFINDILGAFDIDLMDTILSKRK